MADVHVPIEPLEIPRPPVPQPPERLYLFVCDSEDPTPAGKFWASARTQGAGSLQGQSLQEMYERDGVAQMQQAALEGALYGYASQGRRETLAPPKAPTFRRATAEDLLAFGFEPKGDPIWTEPGASLSGTIRTLERWFVSMPSVTRSSVLELLQKRHEERGDGP